MISGKDCSCWLAKLRNEGIPARFHHALFIVLQNFLATGFGGIEPDFEGQMIISTVLMILGRIFQAYIIGKSKILYFLPELSEFLMKNQKIKKILVIIYQY